MRAASPGTRTIAERARSAVFSSLADVILVSGPMTGQPVESANLKLVKDALPATAVFANTGVNLENVGDILKIADGAVVGTHFKKDGDTWSPVDSARATRFMDKVGKLR
jgi:predicted TIM-barrel enzyme